MNRKIFLKIARQIYKIAVKLPRIELPQIIEKEVLDCYYDFVNNTEEISKTYVIENIRQKCQGWKFESLLKNRFDNKIILQLHDYDEYHYGSFTDMNHDIYISVEYDNNSDIDNITHEVQHYFQHDIIDEEKLKKYIEQAKEPLNDFNDNYLLRQSQFIQQIGSCCKRLFNLYMTVFYKEVNFQQFYQKYIEDKLQINVDKLKSSRFESKLKSSLKFLSLYKNKDINQYNKIKQQIIEYTQVAIKQRQNLEKILQSKNYSLIQKLILENKQDQSFIKNAIDILIINNKTKLLTVIIQHFQLFDLIDYNKISFVHMFNIFRFCKNKQNKKKLIENIAKSKNSILINKFIFNLYLLKLDKSFEQQLIQILKNWINLI